MCDKMCGEIYLTKYVMECVMNYVMQLCEKMFDDMWVTKYFSEICDVLIDENFGER